MRLNTHYFVPRCRISLKVHNLITFNTADFYSSQQSSQKVRTFVNLSKKRDIWKHFHNIKGLRLYVEIDPYEARSLLIVCGADF